jgi:ComF family protein
LDIKQTELVCPFCERLSIGGLVHPVCKRKYGLDGLWSLGVYQPPLRQALQKIKYQWIKDLAEILVDITLEYWAKYQPVLLEQIKKDQGKDWQIVPVPLHSSRERWRGFNQSALLAKLLADKLGLKYLDDLKRIKRTKPQVGLKSDKRRQNIRGAFALTNEQSLASNVLLIDDVWITGSTLKECCYVLKRSGAKKIWALTLAR